jgi:hypothetical protein
VEVVDVCSHAADHVLLDAIEVVTHEIPDSVDVKASQADEKLAHATKTRQLELMCALSARGCKTTTGSIVRHRMMHSYEDSSEEMYVGD